VFLYETTQNFAIIPLRNKLFMLSLMQKGGSLSDENPTALCFN